MNLTETTNYTDRDGIVDAAIRVVEGIDFALSNIRVRVDGDTAQLTCYLIGQHHRAGHGPSVETQDHLLLGNRFETDLVRDHGYTWLIRRNRVSSRWSTGNPAAAAIPAA